MAQNRSSAVMHQRVEAPDALDDYPTPSWSTRAAIEVLELLIERWHAERLRDCEVREPCANRGYMVKPLKEYFAAVHPSDVHDYGSGYPVVDYLFPGPMTDAEITFINPPFNLGADFILKSFETPGWRATAAIVRTGFLEGQRRYERLFSKHPPTLIAQHTERVIMHKGIVRDPDVAYWDGAQWRKPSTATSYCWIFWVADVPPQPFAWIPPCRKRLTRPGDYEASLSATGRGSSCSEPSLLA